MSLSKQFLTDVEAERNGFKAEIGDRDENGNVAFFMIARISPRNIKYQKAARKAGEPLQMRARAGVDIQEELNAALVPVFCAHALKGWGNIPLGDVTGNDGINGRPLDEGYAPFNVENAVTLFKRLPELYSIIEAKAYDMGNYMEAERDGSVKN